MDSKLFEAGPVRDTETQTQEQSDINESAEQETRFSFAAVVEKLGLSEDSTEGDVIEHCKSVLAKASREPQTSHDFQRFHEDAEHVEKTLASMPDRVRHQIVSPAEKISTESEGEPTIPEGLTGDELNEISTFFNNPNGARLESIGEVLSAAENHRGLLSKDPESLANIPEALERIMEEYDIEPF